MREHLRTLAAVARKEFRGFFATPAAYLFLGAFLAVTLFVFFWVETFFSRNIADVRPLFQWLPLLLVFLVGALTMRAWSEERRAGTLEGLLTTPVPPLVLVLGKFAASMLLVALALALTLPLPITVALLGPLDWGPVVGGYVATLFLGASYVAIGLYMSGRTDNAIVALILTCLCCGLFYLVGSTTLTNLMGHGIGGLLALLGTGSRFESITRGVIDLRDLYYYASLVGVFLTLNLFSLERLRWAGNPRSVVHRRWGLFTGLVVANVLAANVWLQPITFARIDLTQGRSYSLSSATRDELRKLQEPLLVRGYFSAKTHPLLLPLVPRLKDMLQEYALAAKGRARVEFIDPTRDRAAEEEAASRYGVRPVPFQTADRYQAAVVSSYFDLVIAYGDQFETLGFRDLIEVKARGEGAPDVMLKDPEYAITRAIRKVAGSYRAAGNPFEGLKQSVTFKGYCSAEDRLPEALVKLRQDLASLLEDLRAKAGGRLEVRFEDPEGGNGKLAQELNKRHGFVPQVASLLDPRPFWFYMVLESGNEALQVALPENLEKEALKRSLEATLRRLAPGALRTIAFVEPPQPMAQPSPFGQMPQERSAYTDLEKTLGENARIRKTDLKSGLVPEEADVLLVLAPKALDDKQRFAIDQFLMRGGSVLIATSPFDIQVTHTLSASKQDSGLEAWLSHHGISLEPTMVLDRQCAPLPVPTQRIIGGMAFREIRMMPYPHFLDLRGKGLDAKNPITANLGQLTLNWASPLGLDMEKQKARRVTELLKSSPQSWTSPGLDLIPDYTVHPDTGFGVSGPRGSKVLAVALEGRFTSFFEGKPSPLAFAGEPKGDEAKAAPKAKGKEDPKPPENTRPVASVIGHSPDTARLIVVGSATLASDMALGLVSQGMNTQYTKPLAFLQNALDWSLEDRALLALRGRTQLARTLAPLPEGRQRIWEWTNYALGIVGLVLVWLWRRRVQAADRRRHLTLLAEV